MVTRSGDLFNRLPEPLVCHILSFLSTKEAASTSVLSKRWRYILTCVPNLEFDDSDYLFPEKRIQNPLKGIPGIHPCFRVVIGDKLLKLSTSFPYFVCRILAMQREYPLQKFFLKVVDTHDPVDEDGVNPWIENALSRGVSDFHLAINLDRLSTLTPKIFLTKTLVKLRICIRTGPTIDVKNVHLPKLKRLHLEESVSFSFTEEGIGFNKLLSGCPVLEELLLDDIWSCNWESFSVSVTTLKRLKLCCSFSREDHDENPKSVSLDTPNLVYLEYTEVVADQYPKVKFDSLVEAKIDLSKLEEVDNIVGNATDFVMGISNVRRLYLSANTLEVLTFCCKAIPIFNNLTHLTIETKQEVGWESLPGLLNNCPKLETLVFEGFHHKCGEVDGCLCKLREDMPTCLSSSPVKVLKILKFGEICGDDDKEELQIKQVKNFLKTMPNLEQLILHLDTSFNGDVNEVSTQLQMLTRVASPKCKVQLITSNLRESSMVILIEYHK